MRPVLLLSLLPALAVPVLTQTPVARVTRPINGAELQRLPRNVHPLARAEFDRGTAPPDLPMERMLLVLSPSAEQQAALTTLLDAQQDPASPQYHKWLTPKEFGARFGPADQDIQSVTSWLESQGFSVARVSKGKTIIEFSGTAAQVNQAFHTEIHKFVVNGEEHWANATDPQIPAALAPIIGGVATMHNFLKQSMLAGNPQKFEATLDANGKTQFTNSSGAHALSPEDYWKIYNDTFYSQSASGGIAIVARSNINSSDITYFEQYFLPYSYTYPAVSATVNGTDPGDLGGGEEGEAVLDTSWAIATGGMGNKVQLVVSKTTNASDGVDLSEEYIIDNNLAAVMSESFGLCEGYFTQSQANFYSSLAQQAAAQGITYVVAAGDSGSSGCNVGSDTSSSGTLSVNLLASNPYVTAVGGTEFNENGNDASYWASNNASYGVSVLSYIPEVAWNESCTAPSGANPCTGSNTPGLWAGGGGASHFYAKPSWQSGVPGIPNDGARDVPDVSLTAAGHDPYLLCLAGSCVPNSLGRISFYGYAGTSAATPAFAGFVASLNRAAGGRLGNLNPFLYNLAKSELLGGCNASNQQSLPGPSCIFNDVTIGNNAVPGEPGYNTPAGTYQTGVGYDLATGLGSLNVSNLVSSLTLAYQGPPALALSTTTLDFGNVVIGSTKNLQVNVTNTGTASVRVLQLGITGFPAQYSAVGCPSFLLPGDNCTFRVTFAPRNIGIDTEVFIVYGDWESNSYRITLTGTGIGLSTPILSATSLAFGNQKVATRGTAQTITVTNSTASVFNASAISLTGSNPTQFAMGTNCGTALGSGATCSITVLFTPARAGTQSANIVVPGVGNIALSGTGTLNGYFEIFNAGTGKVLEVAGGSRGNGALIEQDSFNGDRLQQFSIVPAGSGSYEIASALTGKALDVINASLSNGSSVQQYDYLGAANQQWMLVAVDDVHYAIINVNSGKALDIPFASTVNGVSIQQYDYLGDPQQLWVLLPAQTYNVTNNLSSLNLDLVGPSQLNGTQIDQATANGLRDQQWVLVPSGGGYYSILNRLSGKVLDDTGFSVSNGTVMQEYDSVGGMNQQWRVVPVDSQNYDITNRLSGKALDDRGYSLAPGTFIQQWDYSGTSNQLWQITPVPYYNIQNALSGLVLDVPGGSTASGQLIQQWAANGNEQQEWEIVQGGNGTVLIINNLTSLALDVFGASVLDGAQIDETTPSGAASQFWQLFPAGGNNLEILNTNSRKALDDTGFSLSNGNILQQYDYVGGLNQQWQLVPVVH
jgi:hypothetical protein